jgi:hypothetical protein
MVTCTQEVSSPANCRSALILQPLSPKLYLQYAIYATMGCCIGSYNTFRRDSRTVLLSEVEVAAEVNTTLVLRYGIYFQISSTLT